MYIIIIAYSHDFVYLTKDIFVKFYNCLIFINDHTTSFTNHWYFPKNCDILLL